MGLAQGKDQLDDPELISGVITATVLVVICKLSSFFWCEAHASVFCIVLFYILLTVFIVGAHDPTQVPMIALKLRSTDTNACFLLLTASRLSFRPSDPAGPSCNISVRVPGHDSKVRHGRRRAERRGLRSAGKGNAMRLLWSGNRGLPTRSYALASAGVTRSSSPRVVCLVRDRRASATDRGSHLCVSPVEWGLGLGPVGLAAASSGDCRLVSAGAVLGLGLC
eukprot:6194714-Pleurochrysis_carterae.AAC.2